MKTRIALITIASMLLVLPSGTAATFNDGNYHEYVLYDWDTVTHDVLILPSASPFALTDTAAIEKGIDAWEAGVQHFGAPWLTSAFDVRHYTLGLDVPTQEALLDPEIIVVSAEYNPVLLFGIGLMAPISWCHGLGPGAGMIEIYNAPGLEWHQHEGSPWAVAMAQCADGGNQCIVLNTNFLLGGVHRIYDLNAHEFGHCLGAGHVGDALDFSAQNFPEQDIMSYQYDPNQVHCVSNLNVRVLEGVYAPLLGRPQSEWLHAGDYYHMAPGDYRHVNCQNPSNNLLGGMSLQTWDLGTVVGSPEPVGPSAPVTIELPKLIGGLDLLGL